MTNSSASLATHCIFPLSINFNGRTHHSTLSSSIALFFQDIFLGLHSFPFSIIAGHSFLQGCRSSFYLIHGFFFLCLVDPLWNHFYPCSCLVVSALHHFLNLYLNLYLGLCQNLLHFGYLPRNLHYPKSPTE